MDTTAKGVPSLATVIMIYILDKTTVSKITYWTKITVRVDMLHPVRGIQLFLRRHRCPSPRKR